MLQLNTVVIFASFMAHLAVTQQYGAMTHLGQGMSPRYFYDSPQLAKRQSGVCGTGFHPCQDVNQPDFCCPDDRYCYINASGQAACCATGAYCDNPCAPSQGAPSQYLCGPAINVTGTASVTTTCCQRPCSAYVAYQCAKSYGGACCNLGFSCTTSACISTFVAPITIVSAAPSGCTTSQISCASSLGGGCCNIGAICTSSDNNLLCASTTISPSAIITGPGGSLISGTTKTTSDSILSTSAKAGIGVGIVILFSLVITVLLCFYMRRRKAARSAPPTSQQSDSIYGGRGQSMSQVGATRPYGVTNSSRPVAGPGPYTDDESPVSVPSRGVPLSPHSPSDIIAAIEIGHSKKDSNITSLAEVTERSVNAEYLTEVPEKPEDRVELP